MTECLLSKKEFDDFSKLGRLLKSVPPQRKEPANKSSAALSWSYGNPSVTDALKQHAIYNFLIDDPLFNKAVASFKYTSFYKNCAEKGAEFDEWVLFRLMRIFSLTIGVYLVEGKVNTKADRRLYIVDRKSCIKRTERVEKDLEVICGKFPYYDSINLKNNLSNLKIHIQSKTPSWYPERYGGYVAERLVVSRACQLFDAAFGEISVRVIKHLVRAIIAKTKINISEGLLREWIYQVKDEILQNGE